MEEPNFCFDNRRNYLEILADILELCRTPQAKTHVLYKVNTNFRLLEKYILQLQASRLLEECIDEKKYLTTEKGLKFLEAWANLLHIMYPQPDFYVKTVEYSPTNKPLTVIKIIKSTPKLNSSNKMLKYSS